MELTQAKFSKYAWSVLWFTVLVILWGTFVRLSFSGDGCGTSWPLCHGQIFPKDVPVKTYIEFAHRLMSGVSLLLVIALWFYSRRIFSRDEIARQASFAALCFIIIEALIGAMLVIFGWVAGDESTIRVVALCMHLVNTFFLLAALTITADAATGFRDRDRSISGKNNQIYFVWFLLCLIGASGALASLAGMLFPAETIREGLSQDFATDSHISLQLRILHPLIALGAFFYLFSFISHFAAYRLEVVNIFKLTLLFQIIVGFTAIVMGKSLLVTVIHLLGAEILIICFSLLVWPTLYGRKNLT